MSDLNQNPLDMDLSMVDTSLPLLKGGQLYDLRIAKVEIVKTKDGMADMLKLEMKNAEPATTPKDDSVAAGACTVFDQLVLQPKGKATAAMVAASVGSLVQGVGLTGVTLSTVHQWHKQLEGKTVRAKVDFSPESTGPDGKTYRAKNEVAYYVKK